MALPYFAVAELAATMRQARELQADPAFDLANYRDRYASLVTRSDQELGVLARHLGQVTLSDVLPGTDREAAAIQADLTARLATLPRRDYLSARQIVARHRDPGDDFDLAEFDFFHAPGGHAPMISFRDDPWLGELLHVLRENEVLVSLICHAPVILTSTRSRIDEHGNPYRLDANPFAGTTVSTVPKAAERAAEDYGYLHVPDQQTRLTYYIDEALEAAGIHNLHKPNPASVEVYYEPSVKVVSTNGPQGVDALADEIDKLLTGMTAAHR
ncbi:hypothetical protein E0H26_01955 [Micromonospora zingiberis]|uniref:Type 1 glutamine amidotransferase domain-containing protein n=1 Tax=Micromonospora zingiberis TaxID=2053011 RepID=A0A4R0GS28_9ACTN|nr:hypothetical protein [Micromonospora zingiberis]TCC00477.1 hypothetical protein E0H26_01955 [Micromonospora zingiberis]